ncbi:MAG: PAS domain-containing protein, partial [Ardenticatenaceae bacterium]
MSKFFLSATAVASVAALISLSVQSSFRRGRTEVNPVIEWVASMSVPSLAVLPSSGAIVEANDSARALFSNRPLLELDLDSLFPEQSADIRSALLQAQREGAALLELESRSGALALLLTEVHSHSSPLVALLLSSKAASPPPAPSAFVPLSLSPPSFSNSLDEQLHELLSFVVARWPVRSAALFQRHGMELRMLHASGTRMAWDALALSAVDLGRLFHDGAAVPSQLGRQPLYICPLHLSGISQPWGAVALAPAPGLEQSDELASGASQIATLAGFLIAHARLRHKYQFRVRQANQLMTMRDHLLAHSPRGVLLLNRAGIIEFINAAASGLLEWPREDVTGRPLASLLDDLGPLGEQIAIAVAAPNPAVTQKGSGRLQRPGRRGTEIGFSIEHVSVSSGAMLIFLEDQEGTAAFSETQHHLDRLAILGKMSAMIAHDLRNPLGSILYGVET